MLYDIIGIGNWYLKVCRNCGRYFLTQKATRGYCTRIFTDNMTYKEYGNIKYQRKKLKFDDTYKKYRTIGTRLKTRCIPRKKSQRDIIDPKFINYIEKYRPIGKKRYSDCKKG